MKNRKLIFNISALVLLVIAIEACKTYYFRSNYEDANMLLYEAKNLETKPFLKAHLKNGDVCILQNTWQIESEKNLLTGKGILYDFNRQYKGKGILKIPIDSVAIFETNRKIVNSETFRIALLGVLAGVDVIIGIICLTNPKACFGSCPTFYINEKDNFHYADAEGFTNAIAPSLEYFDIDALNNKAISNNVFSITMKNEALETHCVNDVKLLAYPRNPGERIYQTPSNDFYLCENTYSISNATGNEGEIKSFLRYDDRIERFSLADDNDLNSKEEIYVDFENVGNVNDLGLIINFRQTLMTTYLFYSSLGYMGDKVGDIFSMLETNKEVRENFNGTTKILGGLEVYLWNVQKSKWEFNGSMNETGPIAINRQIIPLENINLSTLTKQRSSQVKLKIVLNKGLWRLDYLALTNRKQKVKPFEILPSSILNKGKIDTEALALINNADSYLISMPGSEYKFNFLLPKENQDYELFLYSKGYYLEWMRAHWIKDKNLFKLKQMVDFPQIYLKGEAKAYKIYESNMEQEFWNSRIDTKNFSYYEK